MSFHPSRLPAALRWAAGLLLGLVIVLAQGLGQWHRVVHAPGLATAHAGHAAHGAHAPHEPHARHDGHERRDAHGPHHREATAAAVAPGGWAGLFDTDQHAEACVLYDQLAHADGMPGLPVVWLPPVWVAAVAPWEGRWQIAAQAAGFLARGPPSGT